MQQFETSVWMQVEKKTLHIYIHMYTCINCGSNNNSSPSDNNPCGFEYSERKTIKEKIEEQCHVSSCAYLLRANKRKYRIVMALWNQIDTTTYYLPWVCGHVDRCGIAFACKWRTMQSLACRWGFSYWLKPSNNPQGSPIRIEQAWKRKF